MLDSVQPRRHSVRSNRGQDDASVRRAAFETLESRQLFSVAAVITEIQPNGNSNGTYAADWFEVTNRGATALDLTGWKVDDGSNAIGNALALRGVTSIPAGKSAIFIETDAAGTTDSTVISAFSNAWFGSTTLPSGFLIGTYGGSGIGLGGSNDGVNLFNGAGNRVGGTSYTTTTAGVTLDNSAEGTTVATNSSVGVNGGFTSANGAEVGSPGSFTRDSLPTSIDLSLYVRTGRHNLPTPANTTVAPGNELALEASALAYNWDTDTLFTIGDEGTSIVQISKTGAFIDTMPLASGEFADVEGITYIGGGKFVIVEERVRQLNLFTYAANTTLARSAVQTVKLGATVGNIGLEGLSYDPQTGGFIVVKEKDPQGVFQTNVDFAAGTATNGSPSAENSVNLFDPALLGAVDIADVFALSNLSFISPQSPNLLVLSQESGKIYNVDRSGAVASALTFVGDNDNPLSVLEQGFEGVAVDRNAVLYVVNEQGGGENTPQLWVYEKSTASNAAPTAIALNNQINVLAENTSTVNRLKVADVAVTDDGLGVNTLSVSGTDAAFFEVDSTGLYIKAGVTLDFEARSTYSISVNVDDTSVGDTPDATATYGLTLTDIVDETVVIPSIIISEVVAWGNGNTSYNADWFEITNTGATTVDLTGWKWDDDSNLFSSGSFLTGVSSIAPGQSVVFVDGTSTTVEAFRTAWFGTSVPAGFAIGTYNGPGLGNGGDNVNIFDDGGNRVTAISVGAVTVGQTFDNSERLGSATEPFPTVTTLSVAGVNNAFTAADNHGVGSPGLIGPPPPPPPTIVIDDVTLAEGHTGLTPFVFTVTRIGGVSKPASVDYATAYGNSQTSSADLEAQSGTIEFAANEATKTITIFVKGDTQVEVDNLFYVNLSNAEGAAIDDGQGAGTIINDDGLPPSPPPLTTLPSIIIDNVAKNEGNSGLTPFTFIVSRIGSVSAASSVKWQTTYGDSNTSAADLAFQSGVVNFAAGQTSKTITINVKGDTQVETTNLFFVDLFAPTGAVIGDSRGTGTILNDDGVSPPPPPTGSSLTIGDVRKFEGNGGQTQFVFHVTRTSAVGTASVKWSTAFGTANAGDLNAQAGTVHFAAGQTSRAVIVYVKTDTLTEANETFVVNLAGAVNASILDGQGQGTILNDD